MERAPERDPVTELLARAGAGDGEALDRLFPVVYEELKGLARARLRDERPGHTLNTTALVHEAYLKLVDHGSVQWRDQAHFRAIASRAMRQILINYAEMRSAQKRGGGATHLPLDEAVAIVPDEELDDLLALDEALERLRAFDARGAEVVVCRFFGGLSWDEVAEVVGTSAVTARRTWTAARSWLHRELHPGSPILAPE